MNDGAHAECREMSYADIAVGDTASFSVTITPALVAEFATWSGDHNPLHTDAAYAAETPFGKPIAHGMIIAGLFSRLIGMHLPGKYSVYLSQAMRFHQPTAIGSEVLIRGTVTGKTNAYQTVQMSMSAEDARSGEILVNGDAMIKLLK